MMAIVFALGLTTGLLVGGIGPIVYILVKHRAPVVAAAVTRECAEAVYRYSAIRDAADRMAGINYEIEDEEID